MKESSGATLASSSRWPLLPPGGACRVRTYGRKANSSISATAARMADLIGAAPSSCARSSSSARISGAARKVVAWLKHQRAPTWSVSRSWRARASRVGGAAPLRTRCSRSAWSCRARSAQRARARRRPWPHQQSDEQRDRARWKCSSASTPRAAGATAADRQIAGRAARRPSALRAARERARVALAIDVMRRRGRARRRAAAPRGGARPAPPRPTGGSLDARRAGADGRRTEGGASARGRRARLAECRSRPPRIGARDGVAPASLRSARTRALCGLAGAARSLQVSDNTVRSH